MKVISTSTHATIHVQMCSKRYCRSKARHDGTCWHRDVT